MKIFPSAPVQALQQDESFDGSPLPLEDIAGQVHLYKQPKDKNLTEARKKAVTLKPLTSKEARTFVSHYTQRCNSMELSLPSLWVVCDGAAPENLAYLGVAVAYSQNGTHTDSIYRIILKGPCSKAELPRGQDLVSDHKFRSSVQRVDISCSARYDILDSTMRPGDVSKGSVGSTPRENGAEDGVGGTVSARIQWPNFNSLLHCPPQDANALLDIHVAPGDPQSLVFSFYQDLIMLQGITCGLKEGMVNWANNDRNITVLKRTKNLINEMKTDPSGKGDGEGKAAGNDTAAPVNHMFKERTDYDFVEILWTVLRDCISHAELYECLQLVLKALSTQTIQPMVHRWNKGQLAELVRESYYGKMVIPDLRGVKSLEMLAEMGLEKLCRDYMLALVEQGLVTATHLSSYTGTEGSIEDRVKRLEKLHVALELAMMLRHTLKLSHALQSLAIRNALTKLLDSDELLHMFTIKVQVNSIASFLERCHATNWAVKLSSKAKHGDDVCSLHRLTQKHPIPHLEPLICCSQKSSSVTDDDDVLLSGHYLMSVTQAVIYI